MEFYIYNKKGKSFFQMDEVNGVVEVIDLDYSNPVKAIEKLMQIHTVWKQSPDQYFRKFVTNDTFADYDDLMNLAKFFRRIGSVITARRELDSAIENAMENNNIECCEPSVELGDLLLLDARGNTVKVNSRQFSEYGVYLDYIYDQTYYFDRFCELLGDMYEEMAYKYDEYLAENENIE